MSIRDAILKNQIDVYMDRWRNKKAYIKNPKKGTKFSRQIDLDLSKAHEDYQIIHVPDNLKLTRINTFEISAGANFTVTLIPTGEWFTVVQPSNIDSDEKILEVLVTNSVQTGKSARINLVGVWM